MDNKVRWTDTHLHDPPIWPLDNLFLKDDVMNGSANRSRLKVIINSSVRQSVILFSILVSPHEIHMGQAEIAVHGAKEYRGGPNSWYSWQNDLPLHERPKI